MATAQPPRRDSLAQVRESESNLSKTSSGRRVSIAAPLPLPKIHIQHPTDASEVAEAKAEAKSATKPEIKPKVTPPQVQEAPTIDSRLADERKTAFEAAKARLQQDVDAAKKAAVTTQATLEGIESVPAHLLQPRKSTVALRKTRNLLVREFFLEALLGRELAAPTKLVLRKRARGETVTIEDVSVDVSASLKKARGY